MKFLITGHLGFVGAETKRYIESFQIDNPEYQIDNPEYGTMMNTTLRAASTINEHQVIGYDIMDGFDIRDAQQFDEVVTREKPDRILHLAAIARFADADKDPQLAFETNVLGTKNVVDVAKKYHIPLVYASTGSVYMPITDFTGSIKEDWPAKGNSVYGCTKYAGETYVASHNPHIILRYAHLYGPLKVRHGLIGGYLSRIERGMAPTLYGGAQSNDMTHVKDIARANFLALTAPWSSWNEIYNVGTGEELSAIDAGAMVIKGWNEAFPDKKWEGEVTVQAARTVDPERFWFDCSKAVVGLGFKAQFSFETGLKDMFAELKEMKTNK